MLVHLTTNDFSRDETNHDGFNAKNNLYGYVSNSIQRYRYPIKYNECEKQYLIKERRFDFKQDSKNFKLNQRSLFQ
jgi:hypothetical protein